MSRTQTADQGELLPVEIPPAARHPKVRMITRSEIFPDPEQPREEADADLRNLLAREGMLQPLTVRPHPTMVASWMIVDGERRWRSAEGVLNDLPCIVRNDLDDPAARLALQLTANSGKPLSPLEEARAFGRLLEETGASVADVAKMLGRAPSTVAERLALLDLGPWLPLIERGVLVMSHAIKVLVPLRGIPDQFQEKMVAEVSPYFEGSHEEGRELRLEDVRKSIHRAAKPFLYPLAKTKAYGAKSPEFNTSKHDQECGCGVIRVALGYDAERAYCGDPTWWRPLHNAAMRKKHPVSKGARATPASKAKQKELYLPAGTKVLKSNYGATPSGAVRLTDSTGRWAPERQLEPFDPADLDLTQMTLVQWPNDGGYPSVGTKDTAAIEAARQKWRLRAAHQAELARADFARSLAAIGHRFSVAGPGVTAVIGALAELVYDEELERMMEVASAVGLAVPKALGGQLRFQEEQKARAWVKELAGADAERLLVAYLAVSADTVKLPSAKLDDFEDAQLAAIQKRAIPWLTKPKEEKALAPKKAPAKKSAPAPRTPAADFMKPMYPSATLATVVGSQAQPRTEVAKKLWTYIKKHGLQDTKNRRTINADDTLRAVFGGKASVSIFEMTKLLNKHLAGTAEAAALIYTSKKKGKKSDDVEVPLSKLSAETAEMFDEDEDDEAPGVGAGAPWDDDDGDLWDSGDELEEVEA